MDNGEVTARQGRVEDFSPVVDSFEAIYDRTKLQRDSASVRLDQLVAGVIDQTAASRAIEWESSHIVELRHVTYVTATNTYNN